MVQMITGGAVDPAAVVRVRFVKRGSLRRKHGVIKPFHIIVSLAYDHRSRHIRGVSVDTSAEVHR